MSSDDVFECKECGTFFTTADTLERHCVAIHKRVVQQPTPPSPSQARSGSAKRARADEDGAMPSENVELEPLLGALSEAQKDALILRAVQADPAFYDRILEQAAAPLTDEAADARVSALDSEGIASAVRWFVANGVPGNGISLLVAASQRCLAALEEVADSGSTDATTDNAHGDAGSSDAAAVQGRDGLLAVVEALPAAGAVGALWVELLAAPAVAGLLASSGDEQLQLRLMLEALQSAAQSVREVAPAVLVGSQGQTIETIAEAISAVDALGAPTAAAKQSRKA